MDGVDEAVQATNDDASGCKRSAVKLGYWQDPYISMFVKAGDRKAPEIHRGTYARVKGVERFIDAFIEKTGTECQIVNLGAGFDTLYWRLVGSGRRISNYIEVDFSAVTARKCWLIKRNKQLLEKIHVEDGEIRLSPTDLHASGYHIVGLDLRNVNEFDNKLMESDVCFDLPTLIISECVLVYVEISASNVLLKHIAEKFKAVTIVSYEQINLSDRFGEVMLQTLRARRCPLAGAAACQSLQTQIDRLVQTGFIKAASWDMVTVYNSLPSADRQRIETLELLDEQEILLQLLQHYCIATGANAGGIVLGLN